LPRDGALYGGGVVKKVSGKEAGLPLDSLPGAKAIQFGESKKMDVQKQRTGLFLVGIDFVPRELAAILDSKGLTLNKDGSLVDRNGDPAVTFVTSENYHVQVETPKVFPDKLSPEARPFPWACWSWAWWATYHQTGVFGNHRWFDTGTSAVAYGADSRGGCGNGKPHTHIDYMQAIAAVNWPGNFQQGWDTDQISAYDEWDVGYGWPAFGVPTTTNSVILADGAFSISRTSNYRF
jgi:hypothetical protein